MEHLDEESLAAAAEGKASPESLSHLADCGDCRSLVLSARRGLEAPRRSILPWAAAAAVLLAAGAWKLSHRPSIPAPAAALPSAAWLVEEGKPWTASRDAQPFVLEGGVPGAAWGGTRIEVNGGNLRLEKGEALLRIPEGLTLSLGSVPLKGEVWIGVERTSASLLREARAAEPCRIWTGQGPEPAHLRALRAALPLQGKGSREGLISVRLKRPPAASEVLLAFPQPSGARAWLLGDWKARGYPETATFSVAYGPWGARGSVEGRRVWSLDAAGAAALPKPPAGVEAGISAKGGRVEALRTESWGAPE